MTEEDNVTAVLGISLLDFKDKLIGGKGVTVYTVEVTSRITKKTWQLEKRYSEFKTFRDGLIKLIPNLPPIPGTTLFKVTSIDALNKRKELLEQFLRACVQRKDILNIDSFRIFLDIEKNAPELIGNDIKMNYEYLKVPLGVRDFLVVPHKEIMCMCCSDMNIISRADSMLTNFNFPWEKKQDTHIPLGAAFIYQCKPKDDGEYEVHKIWAKSFPIQTGVIYWEDETEVFCIGLDDGKIFAVKHNGTTHFMTMDPLLDIKLHTDRVMGIGFDSRTNYLYSCSTDKTFYATDVSSNPPNTTLIKMSMGGYTNLHYDKKNDRIFMTNDIGELDVFLTNSFPPCEILCLPTSSYCSIRALHIDLTNKYIFTGDVNGKISIFNLGIPGKEKLISEMSNFGANMKIRICRYNANNHELITGDEDGRVTIWSLKNGQPVHCWEAHKKSAITQMHFDTQNQLLWTGGKDKAVRVWKLPEKWSSSEVENFESNEVKKIEDNLAYLRVQKTVKMLEEDESDSSADDLNGWDFQAK